MKKEGVLKEKRGFYKEFWGFHKVCRFFLISELIFVQEIKPYIMTKTLNKIIPLKNQIILRFDLWYCAFFTHSITSRI